LHCIWAFTAGTASCIACICEPGQAQSHREVAAIYPINTFLPCIRAGLRQHTLESFPPGCTPAMLGTMMQTGVHHLGDVSPYGVRLLVSSPINSVCIDTHVLCVHSRCRKQEQRCALHLLLSFVTCHDLCSSATDSCDAAPAHHSLLKPDKHDACQQLTKERKACTQAAYELGASLPGCLCS